MGVNLVRKEATMSHSSIQSKERSKIETDEATLRQMDSEYEKEVGSCELDSLSSYK